MHGFKSAILAIFQFCQSGTFEPEHEIQNFFGQKTSFQALWKCHLQKNIHNFFLGPQNPGFRSVKVQTEDFLKKDSQHFKKSFQFGSCEYLASLESKIRRCSLFLYS